MTQRTFLAVFAVAMLALGTGCAIEQGYCGGGACGASSGTYGPEMGYTEAAPLAADFGHGTHCDDCGGDACGNCGGCRACGALHGCGAGLIDFVHRVFSCDYGCGGEIYWNEWHNDPPDSCDPCGCAGEYIGPRPCGPRFWTNPFYFLWGHQYGEANAYGDGYGDAGCTDCGNGESSEVIESWEETPSPRAVSKPTPARRVAYRNRYRK